MKDCKHLVFSANVVVNRLLDDNDQTKVANYIADLTVKCNDCGLPFEFIGIPGGVSFHQPAVGIDRLEARLPIVPSTDPVEQIKAMQ